MKKHFLLLLSLMIVATGCEWDVSGTITANQQLNFNWETSAKKMAERQKKGKELYKVLPAGRYSAELEFADKHMDLKANKLEVRFLLPKNRSLPKYGGQLFIPAAETGQTYDLNADVKMELSQSSPTRAIESCTEYIPYEDCSCTAEGEVKCSRRSAAITGEMDVEYHYSYTTRDIVVQLQYAGTSQVAGVFDGQRVDSDKVYSYKSSCHIEPYKIHSILRTERHQVRNCHRKSPDQPQPDRPERPDRPNRPRR